MGRKYIPTRGVLVLCSLCVAVLLNGCVRFTPLSIASHYPFPVAVYVTTHSNHTPTLLGVVASGAVLNRQLEGSDSMYRLDVRRVHGKSIKHITISEQDIIATDVLVIGR